MTDESRSGATEHGYELGRDERPSVAVVQAVSAVIDRSPLEMDPLSHAINPDALDGVFEPGQGSPGTVTVSFEYGGCTVTVTADEVRVYRSDAVSSSGNG